MALITTVAGETSDSYVTVAQADSYFNNHYSSAKKTLWDTLRGPQKESVLRRACQQLETLKVLDAEYGGGSGLPSALLEDEWSDITIRKYTYNQRLQFPRNVDVSSAGVAFVPQEPKDAQCEQAVHMINFDEAAISLLNQGIVEEAVTAGAVKSYTRYSEAGGAAGTYLSPLVIELMRPYLRRTTRMRRA